MMMSAPLFVRSSFCSQNGCVEVAASEDGTIMLRDGKDAGRSSHFFSTEEWDAFVAGVKAGEFDTARLAGRI
jgi:hypothetical protein